MEAKDSTKPPSRCDEELVKGSRESGLQVGAGEVLDNLRLSARTAGGMDLARARSLQAIGLMD